MNSLLKHMQRYGNKIYFNNFIGKQLPLELVTRYKRSGYVNNYSYVIPITFPPGTLRIFDLAIEKTIMGLYK
jgi:hypothetical protein